MFPNFPRCEALKALCYFGDGDLSDLPVTERDMLVRHVDRVAGIKSMPIISRRLGT